MTDANNPANRSTNLGLGGASTAGNVAIQLLRQDDTAIAFGPDSAAVGTTNQWLIGPSSSVTGIPLTAHYIATGSATPGSVSAVATFTLSYQ
jgi:type 1 fimbria pilin